MDAKRFNPDGLFQYVIKPLRSKLSNIWRLSSDFGKTLTTLWLYEISTKDLLIYAIFFLIQREERLTNILFKLITRSNRQFPIVSQPKALRPLANKVPVELALLMTEVWTGLNWKPSIVCSLLVKTIW
jgi:hypothetical protein